MRGRFIPQNGPPTPRAHSPVHANTIRQPTMQREAQKQQANKVFMAAYTNYRRDPRVRREAEALVEAGYDVVFLASRQPGEPSRETINGVRVIKAHGIKNRRTSMSTYLIDYALFFVAMAALNELVWRTQSTDVWVTFKVFGLSGLTFLFILSQIPFVGRQARLAEAAGANPARSR